jgi:hypothetical protein
MSGFTALDLIDDEPGPERTRKFNAHLDAQCAAFKVLHPQDAESPGEWLAIRAGHLQALTASMNGDGFDRFTNLHEKLQRNLIWLLDELANEIVETIDIAEHMRARKIQAENAKKAA